MEAFAFSVLSIGVFGGFAFGLFLILEFIEAICNINYTEKFLSFAKYFGLIKRPLRVGDVFTIVDVSDCVEIINISGRGVKFIDGTGEQFLVRSEDYEELRDYMFNESQFYYLGNIND